jgi:hypothetical protein
MSRTGAVSLIVCLALVPAVPAVASDRTATPPVAPSKAVADAWAREERKTSSSKTLTALQVSYVGLQGLDMWSTFTARSNGAREVNPLMAGGYGTGAAIKAALTTGTIFGTRAIAKKNRKAAVVTMWVINAVTAVVVANNISNARR